MAVSKIEKLGLAKRIEELISSGVTSSPAIASALKLEGHNVSQPTVSRHLKAVRESRAKETSKIVQDHVRDVVPADLEALENMETVCLDWSKEDIFAFAHRLASRFITDHLTEWRNMIMAVEASLYADPKEFQAARGKAVQEIMDQCIRQITDELIHRKMRMSAMRQASQIIALKLQYSGALGAGAGGNIFLMGSGPEDPQKDETAGQLMVFPGGKNA